MLIVLIYYRSWEVGVILLVLVALRRAPWFANAIANDLSIDQQHGMTAWVARVLLPAWDGARGSGRVMLRWRDATHDSESVQDQSNLPGSERTNEQPAPGSYAENTGSQQGTAGSSFSLTIEELSAVQAMARHRETVMARGETPTKSGSILAGFGVKRGGTQRYERASEIYDALFGAPVPLTHYPNMTPEQKQARDVLGISKPR